MPTPFRVESSARFKRVYDKLPQTVRRKVKRTINWMQRDITYPSVRVKKVKGPKDVWEGRVIESFRLTFMVVGSTIVLRNVGRRDETLKRP